MAGLADLLFGTQANTGTGSQPATQSGPSASTLQAAAPFIGNGFNLGGTPANLFTAGAPQQNSFAQLLQNMLTGGVPFKQSQPDNHMQQEGTFTAYNATPQWTPSPEQSQRLSQWENLLPTSSGGIEDRRDDPVLVNRPPLPAAQFGQAGLQAALQSMLMSRLMPQQTWQAPLVTPNAPAPGPSMPMRFGGSGQ